MKHNDQNKRVFDFTKTPERIAFLEEQVDELQGHVNELTEALDNVERGQMVLLSKLDTVITMLSQVLNTK